MAEELTAEQMKALCIEKMGAELGNVFDALRNELAWLFLKWRQYQELFGTSPERVHLLSQSAHLFFHVIEKTLWEDTLLHLARLTDPPETGGRKDRQNLTVLALPALIQDPQLRQDVTALATEAQVRTAFAVDWRNRHIAHRDLRLAIQEPIHELAPASRQDVSLALEALVAVLDRLELHFLGGETWYDHGGDPGDAVSLLVTLREGVEADKQRRDRLSRGEPLQSDLRGWRPI